MSHDIFLIRHGAAAAAWTEALDPGLSADGRGHAHAVAVHFAGHAPCRLVSSPLLRAQETAAPLAAQWRAEVSIEPRVREIPSSVSMAERPAWLRQIMASRWPDVDAGLHAWRANAASAVAAYGSDTLVFTHFMVINALVALATGDERLVCFEPDYGSITHLRCEHGGLALVTQGKARPTLVL